MCHGYYPHDHDELAAEHDGPDESEESEPSFLADEASVDSELLTDGGNEDDE
jgi:hypothetical protein